MQLCRRRSCSCCLCLLVVEFNNAFAWVGWRDITGTLEPGLWVEGEVEMEEVRWRWWRWGGGWGGGWCGGWGGGGRGELEMEMEVEVEMEEVRWPRWRWGGNGGGEVEVVEVRWRWWMWGGGEVGALRIAASLEIMKRENQDQVKRNLRSPGLVLTKLS